MEQWRLDLMDDTGSLVFAHWYLYMPLGIVAYLLIGGVYGAVHEAALRRLQGIPWKTMSTKNKVLAYTLFAWISLCMEPHNVFQLTGKGVTDEAGWKRFRNIAGTFWPFWTAVNILGWAFNILSMVLTHAYAAAKYALYFFLFKRVVAPVGNFFFSIPDKIVEGLKNDAPSNIVTRPFFAPPEEKEPISATVPVTDPKRQRVAELRLRVATREAELDAEKQALLEAEMDIAAETPPYRDAMVAERQEEN